MSTVIVGDQFNEILTCHYYYNRTELQMRQSTLPISWHSNYEQGTDSDEQDLQPVDTAAYKTPLAWSRVKSLNQMKTTSVTTFDV